MAEKNEKTSDLCLEFLARLFGLIVIPVALLSISFSVGKILGLPHFCRIFCFVPRELVSSCVAFESQV